MKLHSTFALLALAALVTGCQSTAIRSAWFDTDFAGPPMRKIIVVGSINSVTDGRLFEDVFAEKLRAVGVEAVPGYTVMVDSVRASDAPFVAAS